VSICEAAEGRLPESKALQRAQAFRADVGTLSCADLSNTDAEKTALRKTRIRRVQPFRPITVSLSVAGGNGGDAVAASFILSLRNGPIL
jgi:hypothetical protein